MDENIRWAAGRDLALLRRCGNPETPQTETFANIVLLRRLLVEGAIHKYWRELMGDGAGKLTVEYSGIAAKRIGRGIDYLVILTGDTWSDLLVGAGIDATEGELRPDERLNCHGAMISGPLNNHVTRSIVLAHRDFAFTSADIITYQAYVMGDVHLPPRDKTRIAPYEAIASEPNSAPFKLQFGSNGPASLALKGTINRIRRSEAFKGMYRILKAGGFVPEDVEYPAVRFDGLEENIRSSACNIGVMSLRWTEHALRMGVDKMIGLPHGKYMIEGRP